MRDCVLMGYQVILNGSFGRTSLARDYILFKQWNQRRVVFHSFFAAFHVSDAPCFLSNMSFTGLLGISIFSEGSSDRAPQNSLVSSACYLDDIDCYLGACAQTERAVLPVQTPKTMESVNSAVSLRETLLSGLTFGRSN